MRPRLRQRQVVAVDARGPPRQRHVIRVADEADPDVLLVAQVVDCLANLPCEFLARAGRVVLVTQRGHEVPDARTARVTLQVAQLADRLDTADLDLLEVLGDEHLLLAQAFLRLVVPDLDLDAAIERPAIGGCVAGDRPRVAGPFERNGVRRQPERELEELGHLARALTRQARIVAIDLREPLRQRLRVGVTDEMHPHVPAVPHAVEDLAQPLDIAARNVGHAGFEAYRRHDARELDGFDLLADDLLRLEPVAGFAFEHRRDRASTCRTAGSRPGVVRRARPAASPRHPRHGRPARP